MVVVDLCLLAVTTKLTTNWVAYQCPVFISHGSRAGKCKIKIPTDLVSGEGLFPGSSVAVSAMPSSGTRHKGAFLGHF